MQLSISNIAWAANQDEAIYELMEKERFYGLEIAPTRIFAENPYEQLEKATLWVTNLKKQFNFQITSMQSIWYGRDEKMFGSSEERLELMHYTQKAIDFAETIQCHNLVFGCPKNRNLPEGVNSEIAVAFFRQLGEYALMHKAVIAIEANPPIYGTNYINNTKSALALVKQVGSKGFLLNLDLGTMIYCEEDIDVLRGNIHIVNHVHISEPGLVTIQKRTLHTNLADLLKLESYTGYVSIEMSRQNDIENIKNIMHYVSRVFQ